MRENRNNLKRLVDISIFLESQDLAFPEHDETSESANRGNYKELLMLFSKYDSNFNNFIASTVFSSTYKSIQNDLIDCSI